MKIALIGYGKMGKTIERIATERGHEIVMRINNSTLEEFTAENLANVDVAIEFTNPESALGNVSRCLKAKVPTISGSTGWNEKVHLAQKICIDNETAFLQASNFSVGVNVFFAINEQLAKLMNNYPEYEITVEETHHTHKKDAPSGTAISIAEQIIEKITRKNIWTITQPFAPSDLSIIAHRIDEVPGTHLVQYTSAIDSIELKHTAHNRDGFALGAVIAAEFLKDKKGIFTMRNVLGI